MVGDQGTARALCDVNARLDRIEEAQRRLVEAMRCINAIHLLADDSAYKQTDKEMLRQVMNRLGFGPHPLSENVDHINSDCVPPPTAEKPEIKIVGFGRCGYALACAQSAYSVCNGRWVDMGWASGLSCKADAIAIRDRLVRDSDYPKE